MQIITVNKVMKRLKIGSVSPVLWAFLIVMSMSAGCSKSLHLVDRPIVFDEEREQLSRQYMKERHGMSTGQATIVPRMVVVHWTAIPTLEKSFQAFVDSKLPSHREGIASASSLNVSAHFLVDRDGTVYQLLPETTFARHVIGLNHSAIGIENVGDGNKLPLTSEQLDANVKLIQQLASRHPIEYVIGHHEYQNFIGHPLWKETDPNYLTEKSDPGDEFMSAIRSRLQNLTLKDVPQKDRLADELYSVYDKFVERSISTRRFKHADIEPLILGLRGKPGFTVKTAGKSIEGRGIHLVSYGQGPVPVFLWSQMHGDEPTATMALMDIFLFLQDETTLSDFKEDLSEKVTLHFIPMLNPDGADKYQRRNTLGVDLNRDALRLQNPESRVLKSVRDSLNAAWGFNLHDQGRYYGAGVNKPHTATMSFLAPAFNYQKDVNEVRGNAMRLIGVLHNVLQRYIPGKIAKYNDDFEPRAFGDNIQKWGTSTILIESGALKGDREKQYIRKLHFVALLHAFHHIAHGTFREYGLDIYENIPFNDSNAFHDFVLRKVTVEIGDQKFIVDIAFRHAEIQLENGRDFYLRAGISDLGDLSTMFSFDEFDASGYTIIPGKVYGEVFEDHQALLDRGVERLLQEGYTIFKLKNDIEPQHKAQLPYKLVSTSHTGIETIQLGSNPSFLLTKDGKIEYIINNGFLYDNKAIKVEWR